MTRQSEPLLSQDWYRFAHMRPRLRAGVRVSRQQVRGETWIVLSDPVSGRYHRFNESAYALIGACNGEATIDELWAARVSADGDAAPSQAEAIRIFAQAFAVNLFIGDIAPDAAAIVKAQQRVQGERRRTAINPLSFRVPLWDPDRFLVRHAPRVAWFFSAPARFTTWLAIACGALLLALNAGAVGDAVHRELGGGRMLLLMWLAYPLMKGLHELAHAFAVNVHGGEVHEIGVTLVLLTPLPYVDASASVAFSDKHRRIGVAAAGIAVEALLASIALVLWLLLEPGLAKDIAFAVVAVGALSTVLVNANPLLRFDGYYVLCDAAELPNLASRSAQYWHYLVKRRLLNLRHVRFGQRARGERRWLIGYAPLAWAYRALLLAVLAVQVAGWNAAAGLAVFALAGWSLLAKPLLQGLRWVVRSGEARGQRPRAAGLFAGACALLLALAFGVPLPMRTHAPAVVWLPDDAMVRSGTDGFVDTFMVRDGDVVDAGAPIARLTNEPLQVELARVDAQLERQRIERNLRFDSDAQRAAVAEHELARLTAERERLHDRIAALTVRAGVAGRVAIDPRRVVVGQYLAQGELIAQVLPAGAPLVRALVRNEDIALVREQPGAITVQLAHGGDATWPAHVGGAVPKASTSLPTAALGETAGGSIALDGADASGRTAREPWFQVDLRLDGGTDARVGARALVTFRHGEASAAALIGRFVRQSFLRFFER